MEKNSPQLFSSSVQKLGGLSEVNFSDVFLLRSAGQARRPLTFCALANKNIFSAILENLYRKLQLKF